MRPLLSALGPPLLYATLIFVSIHISSYCTNVVKKLKYFVLRTGQATALTECGTLFWYHPNRVI